MLETSLTWRRYKELIVNAVVPGRGSHALVADGVASRPIDITVVQRSDSITNDGERDT
jgi:hypothetical protein